MILKSTNPLSMQSQEWLTNALLALMEEKEFKNISITEITAKADLSRRTFYRVFGTKEDVLIYYTDKLYSEFLLLLKQETDRRFTVIVKLYFQFWYRNKHFLELLRHSGMLMFMTDQYFKLFPEVFQIVKANNPLIYNAEALSYAMAFSVGGMLSILIKWTEDGMVKTPEEIMQLMEIVFPYSK